MGGGDQVVGFCEVSTAGEIAAVARLARVIWGEHYEPIIGAGQVAYMLDRFQSAAAVGRQIRGEGFVYFLVRRGGRAVGYVGLQGQGEVLVLSKLYVLRAVRGLGLGRRAVDFVMGYAAARGFLRVRLSVNRYNSAAIAAYERTGFVRCGEVVNDIGGGFVMDDFVFEREVLGAGVG